MLRLNIDIVFQYIYFITRLYIPNNYNKKKIKQLFECIPFFIPTKKDQELLYDLIHKTSIVNYYDSTSNIVTYGYLLYEQYHVIKKYTYLDMNHYIKHYDYIVFLSDQQKDIEYKKKLSLIIFSLIIIICTYFIYAT